MSLLDVRLVADELVRRIVEIEAALAEASSVDGALQAVTFALDDCLQKLSRSNLWGRANEVPSSELWKVAGFLLERGWMQNRARTKPRGYAGDYQLFTRMLEDRLCEDPLGRLFDRYFQNLAAPIAVRNRSELTSQWMVDRVRNSDRLTTIVVVGCGPGIDVERAALALTAEERSRLRVRLLDYDPVAIDNANLRLAAHLAPDQLACEAGSLFRITTRPKLAAWLDGADLIACPGMFDYLDDPSAAAMLATFWQRLAPNGEVAIFNFSPRNTSRAYMEWIGNWYLTYRNEEEMAAVARGAGIPNDLVTHGSESLGVNLYLRARRYPV
jgi:extracellular factor (EF) 3-hydroxypalmitic acid methyl ester biosynthesis protein